MALQRLSPAQQPVLASSRRPNPNPKSARAPNLYYQALPMEQLRRYSRFVPLPPVEDVLISGSSTYRYVQQGTEEWDALHQGVLTTGKLRNALGLAYCRGPMPVYQQLLLPPPQALPQMAPGCSSDQALSHNEARRQAARSAQTWGAEAALGGNNGSGPSSSGGAPGAAAATAAAAAALAQRAVCERVSLGGQKAVQMAWGSIQEASALYLLATLFPQSLLQEVGLYHLNPTSTARPAALAGYAPGELPPLGASPDGMLLHTLQLSPDDLEQLRQAMAAAGGSGSGGEGGASEQQVLRALLQLVPMQTQMVNASVALGGNGTPGGQDSAAAVAAGSPSGPGPMQQAAAAAPVPTPASPSPSLSQAQAQADSSHPAESAAAIKPSAQATTATATSRPAAQATPTLVRPSPYVARAAGEAASSSAAPSSLPVRPELINSPLSLMHSASAALRPLLERLAGGGGSGPLSVTVAEVVEVKNSCCFRYRHSRKARGGAAEHPVFSLSDPGPRTSLLPEWVPQMQLHMLASGALSALLLTRSASRGFRVFRFYRDDAYLSEHMMALVSSLYRQHVLQRTPPPADLLTSDPRHKAFLQRTAELAAGAQLVAHVEKAAPIPFAQTNAFWE